MYRFVRMRKNLVVTWERLSLMWAWTTCSWWPAADPGCCSRGLGAGLRCSEMDHGLSCWSLTGKKNRSLFLGSLSSAFFRGHISIAILGLEGGHPGLTLGRWGCRELWGGAEEGGGRA